MTERGTQAIFLLTSTSVDLEVHATAEQELGATFPRVSSEDSRCFLGRRQSKCYVRTAELALE